MTGNERNRIFLKFSSTDFGPPIKHNTYSCDYRDGHYDYEDFFTRYSMVPMACIWQTTNFVILYLDQGSENFSLYIQYTKSSVTT